ncbi:MAG: Fe-S cluster assembly protein IscX [Rickettsia endosymbiont of Bryobia graminum]|nr:Fe-S cluster assembly protein IscX [Rickettsia endosymbiont of Bryobia graminum]
MHWKDVEKIAESLEREYHDEDISELPIQDLEDLVKSLDDFEDNEVEVNKEVLKEIQEAWEEIRNTNLSK